MSKIVEAIKRELEEHQKILQETPEDAHVHVLFVRRLESMQDFIEEHFPMSLTKTKMLGRIHSLRMMVGEALETKA